MHALQSHLVTIIDYPIVLARMKAMGLVCNYYNSGSFGFPKEAATHISAWIGLDDPTIRPQMRQHVREVSPPFEPTLAELARRVWREVIGGPIWVMPASHWAFEMDFGSRSWMPAALASLGITPAELERRTDGSAIEFSPDETDAFTGFLETLLVNLASSDFTLGFPDRPIVCSVHHHKQLWWITSNAELMSKVTSTANA